MSKAASKRKAGYSADTAVRFIEGSKVYAEVTNDLDSPPEVEATEMQKKAAVLVAAGVPKGDALEQAGYCESFVNHPSRVLNMTGFQKAFHEAIPSELLLEKHKSLLEKKVTITRYNKKTGVSRIVRTKEIDTQAVKAGLDMAYKIKDVYAKPDAPGKTNILNIFSNKSDEELLAIINAG